MIQPQHLRWGGKLERRGSSFLSFLVVDLRGSFSRCSFCAFSFATCPSCWQEMRFMMSYATSRNDRCCSSRLCDPSPSSLSEHVAARSPSHRVRPYPFPSSWHTWSNQRGRLQIFHLFEQRRPKAIRRMSVYHPKSFIWLGR